MEGRKVKLTIADIRNLGPCYEPSRYLSTNWAGTIQDILRMDNTPPGDRLLVACHERFINKETLFKFAENCCWQIVGKLPKNEQLEYCNILSIFRIARETGDDAARDAARDAAWGEFCLMLADMVDGKEIGLDDMFLMDRLQNE